MDSEHEWQVESWSGPGAGWMVRCSCGWQHARREMQDVEAAAREHAANPQPEHRCEQCEAHPPDASDAMWDNQPMTVRGAVVYDDTRRGRWQRLWDLVCRRHPLYLPLDLSGSTTVPGAVDLVWTADGQFAITDKPKPTVPPVGWVALCAAVQEARIERDQAIGMVVDGAMRQAALVDLVAALRAGGAEAVGRAQTRCMELGIDL